MVFGVADLMETLLRLSHIMGRDRREVRRIAFHVSGHFKGFRQGLACSLLNRLPPYGIPVDIWHISTISWVTGQCIYCTSVVCSLRYSNLLHVNDLLVMPLGIQTTAQWWRFASDVRDNSEQRQGKWMAMVLNLALNAISDASKVKLNAAKVYFFCSERSSLHLTPIIRHATALWMELIIQLQI